MLLTFCLVLGSIRAQQQIIKQIYKFLVQQGFIVWLDIHEMAATAPSTLEAMSTAIDESDAVIIAVSRE